MRPVARAISLTVPGLPHPSMTVPGRIRISQVIMVSVGARRSRTTWVARFDLQPSKLMSPIGHFRQIATSAYSAACRDGERTASSPSASVAEIVVRTMSRAWWAGHGRPRCMVARLSHMTTSPLRQVCT